MIEIIVKKISSRYGVFNFAAMCVASVKLAI